MTERKDTAQADEKIDSDAKNQSSDLTEKNTTSDEVKPGSDTSSPEVSAPAEEPAAENEAQEVLETHEMYEKHETQEAQESQETQEAREAQETPSADESVTQEPSSKEDAAETGKPQAVKDAEAKEKSEAEAEEASKADDAAKSASAETPSAESTAGTTASSTEASASEDAALAAETTEPKAQKEKPTEPVKASSGARRMVFLLVAMPLIVAAMAGAGIWHTYSTLYHRPVEMTSDKVEIVVTEGTSASQALNLARNAGMDLPRWETKLLMRLEPDLLKRIHVGKFRFDRGMTPYDVFKTLSGPALIDQQLRIPEGAPIWEVMKVITSGEGIVRKTEGLSEEDLMKALGVEGRKSLEGLLAPETYRYGTGTTDLVILKKAIDHQRHILEAAWEGRSEDCQAKSAYELLILASIIEKETGEKGDRGLVSSVFNNRLRRKMALQTDPTVIYGLGPDWSGRLRRKDLDTPTPWNTYTFVGLPPTPIAMPSAASIEAAAHPTKSNFLYFVARGDGTSEFSESLRQHNRAVKHFILEKRTTPLPGSKSPKPAAAAATAAPAAAPATPKKE